MATDPLKNFRGSFAEAVIGKINAFLISMSISFPYKIEASLPPTRGEKNRSCARAKPAPRYFVPTEPCTVKMCIFSGVLAYTFKALR